MGVEDGVSKDTGSGSTVRPIVELSENVAPLDGRLSLGQNLYEQQPYITIFADVLNTHYTCPDGTVRTGAELLQARIGAIQQSESELGRLQKIYSSKNRQGAEDLPTHSEILGYFTSKLAEQCFLGIYAERQTSQAEVNKFFIQSETGNTNSIEMLRYIIRTCNKGFIPLFNEEFKILGLQLFEKLQLASGALTYIYSMPDRSSSYTLTGRRFRPVDFARPYAPYTFAAWIEDLANSTDINAQLLGFDDEFLGYTAMTTAPSGKGRARKGYEQTDQIGRQGR